MTVVGRGYVTVRAITSQLDKDVDSAAEAALARLDQRLGERLGERLNRDIEKGLSRRDPVSPAIDKWISSATQGRDGRGAGFDLGDVIGRDILSGMDRYLSRNLGRTIANSFDKQMPAVTLAIGDSMNRRFANLEAPMFRAIANPMILAMAAVPAAVGPTLSAIGAYVAAAVPLISPFGPAIAASSAVGVTGLTGLITSVKVLGMALDKNNDDAKKFREQTGKQFAFLGDSVRKELLPALTEARNRFREAFGPVLKEGLTENAEAIGVVANNLSKLSADPIFKGQIAEFFEDNAAATIKWGDSLGNVVSMLGSTLAASGPLTEQFSNFIADWSGDLADRMRSAEQDGSLTKWLLEAGTVAEQVGRIFSEMGGGLYGAFSAAMGPGQRLFDGLEAMMTRFNDFANSSEGAKVLEDSFNRAVDTAQAINRLIGSIVDELSNISFGDNGLVGSIDNLATNLIPALGGALELVGHTSEDFVRAFGPALASIIDLSGPKFMQTISTLSDQLGPALQELAPDLADVANALMDFFTAVSGPTLSALMGLAHTLASVVSPPLEAIAFVFDALPDSVVAVVAAFMTFRAVTSAASSGMASLGTKLKGSREELSGIRGSAVGAAEAIEKRLGSRSMAALGIASFALISSGAADKVGGLNESLMGMSVGFAVGGPAGAAAGALAGLGSAAYKAKVELQGLLEITSGEIGRMDISALDEMLVDVQAKRKDLEGTWSSLDDQLGAMFTKKFWTSWDSGVDEILDEYVGDLTGKEGEIREAKRKIQAAMQFDAKVDNRVAFEQSIDDLDAYIADLKEREGKVSLDIGDQVGRDLKSMLEPLADYARGSGNADVMKRARESIESVATSANLTKEAANVLADTLLGTTISLEDMPDAKVIDLSVEQEEFLSNLGLSKEALAVIEGKTVRLDAQTGEAVKKVSNFETIWNLINDKAPWLTVWTSDGVRAVTNWKNRVWDQIRDKDVSLKVHESRYVFNPGQQRATGGWVFGAGTATSDDIPAMLSNGEFVIRASAASQHSGLVEAINRGATTDEIRMMLSGQGSGSNGGSAGGSGSGGAGMRIVSGTLEIAPSGRAFITGLATEAYEEGSGYDEMVGGM